MIATPAHALRLSMACRTLRRIPTVAIPRTTTVHPPRCNRPPSSTSRQLHTSAPLLRRAVVGHNNEPVPDHRPPTDFESLDVLGSTPPPATSVDVCLYNGFNLNSGMRIRGGDGALLVAGDAFVWRPWREVADPGRQGATRRVLLNAKGQWDVPAEAFGLLGLVWPRPDLLILGLGKEIRPISPETRKVISSLGMRVEILDTRNAASQYNMLATERGVDNVAAALIPIGWKEGVGAV